MPDQGLWAASLATKLETRPLDDEISVDLAIVGGGYTGCAAAMEAARLGAAAALLEAHEVGHGGSGRNVGLVNAGLWLPPEDIIARLGECDGRRLINALAAGPDRVFELIERERIDCEATRKGTLHLAHAPSGLADLRRRARQGDAFGASLQLLDATETRRRTGSERFFGALRNPRAGTVQPLAYCQGLAVAAQRAGARLYGASPVEGVRQEDDGWVLRTASGTVRARALLIAANAYAVAAARPPAPQFTIVNYCQFATAPLPSAFRETVLPGGEGCWDTALVMTSFRLDAAGRLIVGGIGDGGGAGARVHAGWARRKLRALYPELGDLPFDHAWSGRIAMTRDHLPKVVAMGPRALSVFGYSGRGIAPGAVFGAGAARALLLGEESALPMTPIAAYAERFTRSKGAWCEVGAALTHAAAARR